MPERIDKTSQKLLIVYYNVNVLIQTVLYPRIFREDLSVNFI